MTTAANTTTTEEATTITSTANTITTTANSTTTTEITAANPRSTSEMIDEMVADHYFFAVVDMKDPA